MKHILLFFKHIFTWFKWNQEFGLLGNIWWNIQLPNSRGERSLSVTFLVYLGIIPIYAATCTEIFLVFYRGAAFSGGFWTVIGALATGAVGGFTFSEAHKRNVMGTIKKVIDKTNIPATKKIITNTIKISKQDPKPNLES